MPNDPFAKWRVSSVPEASENTEPTRGIGKAALRQVGRLARAGATGIAGIADIPNLAALGLHAAGMKENPTFYEPIAGRVQKGIDTLTGGRLAPENKAEEYMDIIGEGLAPLALSPLTGGASLSGIAARGLAKHGGKGFASKAAQKVANMGSNPYKLNASNVAGSVGSSAALKAYLDEGGDPGLLGPLLASMAGGIGARGALKLKNPLNAAAEGLGRATGFSPEKYAKNMELGLPVTPATVSKSKFPAYAEMIAAKMPGSMDTLEDFYKNREAAIARNLGIRNYNNLEKVVDEIPKNLAKQGAKGYHKRASDIFERREEKFKPREQEAIAKKELIDVSDIIDKLKHEKSLSLTEAAKKRFDKTKEGILLKELRESIPESSQQSKSALLIKQLRDQGIKDEAIKRIVKSEVGDITPEKGIGLYNLNELREKALQESIDLKTPLGEGTLESARAAERSQMLAAKRHQFIEETGNPIEIHNSKQARKFWSSYKHQENGMSKYVARITGATDDATAFNKLTSTNPKFINIARQGLSKEDLPKLAEAIIADLGKRQGRFNINTAYTGFKDLESHVKKEFLRIFPSKASRDNFEKTMQFIGDNKKMMEKLANTSNTAHTNNMISFIKKYGVATAAAATGYGVMPLFGLVLTYAGIKGGAKIWTNQNFLRRMNDVISTNNLKGQTNKLDLLLKSVGQTGRHMKHIAE